MKIRRRSIYQAFGIRKAKTVGNNGICKFKRNRIGSGTKEKPSQNDV
jgi:hypothetical protein